MKKEDRTKGYGFGTFQGVFTPSILTIIGVIVYLRFGWMLGNVGLAKSLLIVTMGSAITFLTGLSISALATNMRMKGGGAYFMLSRSLGPAAGTALGLPLALSQTIAVSFYVAGFAEALVGSGLPAVSGWDPRVVGVATLGVLAFASSVSADWTLRSQYAIMALIAFSFVSFFLGGTPQGMAPATAEELASMPPARDFWSVFAVFFPAVTGILAGVGMSGDLKDPGRAIPRGTLAAVVVGYLVYMAVPIALNAFVPNVAALRGDYMVFDKCARWHVPVMLGMWAAMLSSAVGSFLCAPRVLQALARDRLAPAFLGRGFGQADDPRLAALVCFSVAGLCIWFGGIDVIAPVLTLFHLSVYGLLNLSAALEEAMSNPSWRPAFRVKAAVAFAGFAACLGAMFMISPGWTIVALVCEGAIYLCARRRPLRAHWGDMRAGLAMSGVRLALRRLDRGGSRERNWRPNLLVMTRLPIPDTPLLELAREISGGRSFVTLSSVLPAVMSDASRERELRDSVMRSAEKIGLEAYVHLVHAPNEYAGMGELVRTYGFGPLVPNTLMLGTPAMRNMASFAALVSLAVARRRNVVVMDRDAAPADAGCLDVWWRGQKANGALMLALAVLVSRGGRWRGSRIRANMIVKRRTPEEGRRVLGELLRRFRIEAEDRVIEMDDRPFLEVMSGNSADAAVTFIGLRRPEDGEPPEAYGEYLAMMRAGAASIPSPVFVLAAEDVDFRRIFS